MRLGWAPNFRPKNVGCVCNYEVQDCCRLVDLIWLRQRQGAVLGAQQDRRKDAAQAAAARLGPDAGSVVVQEIHQAAQHCHLNALHLHF